MMATTLRVVSTPDKTLVYTNHIYISPQQAALLQPRSKTSKHAFLSVGKLIYTVQAHPALEANDVGVSSMQREQLQVSVGDAIQVRPYVLPNDGSVNLLSCKLQLELIKVKFATLAEKQCIELVLAKFAEQVLTRGQYFALDVMGTPCKITVAACETPAPASQLGDKHQHHDGITQFSDVGLLLSDTTLEIEAVGESKNFKWEKNPANKRSKLFDPSWNFSDMGIGGLDDQFNMIFRRAFASRMFPPKIVAEMGINHVKGMLLYGPPGTVSGGR